MNWVERESASGRLSAASRHSAAAQQGVMDARLITCRSPFALDSPFSELALGNY
jgi:hypothetical protein